MIVKVQQALSPRGAPALIYDERRQFQVMRRLTRQERYKMAHTAKAYFNAERENDDVTLLDRVADQAW